MELVVYTATVVQLRIEDLCHANAGGLLLSLWQGWPWTSEQQMFAATLVIEVSISLIFAYNITHWCVPTTHRVPTALVSILSCYYLVVLLVLLTWVALEPTHS